MQGPVGDAFATELARAFYAALARAEHPRASRALAAARRELEQKRDEARKRGAPAAGQLGKDGRALLESALILVDLRQRGALEAEYHDLADRLAAIVGEAEPGAEDAEA